MPELRAESEIPAILSILEQGDKTGFEIIQELKAMLNGKLPWAESAIYPVLKKLEKQKVIRSYWVKGDGREVKYYNLL